MINFFLHKKVVLVIQVTLIKIMNPEITVLSSTGVLIPTRMIS